MSRKVTLAAAALVLSTFSGLASADSLSTRAAGTLGAVIASQGNAALVQIKRELRESARQAMKPFLPDVAPAPEPAPPAQTPVAQR
jgi:parvulin-like peptidyl-prolyl isomerase